MNIIMIGVIAIIAGCLFNINKLKNELSKTKEVNQRLKNDLERNSNELSKTKAVNQGLKNDLERYSNIRNLEVEGSKLKEINQELEKQVENEKKRALTILNKVKELQNEVGLLEEASALQEFAYYKPKYHFEDIEEYKNKLQEIKDNQKYMIKNKTAAECFTDWSVGDSKAKGKAMTNDNLKAMIRCFNGECEAAISKVKYNNVHTMEKRIKKSFEMVNKLNKRNDCHLNELYLNLKLSELQLNYEYHQKQQEIKEEQRAIREQMKEEEKARKEYEKAKEDAKKEEKQAQKALEKAKSELESAHGAKVDKLKEKLRLLQERLDKSKEMGLRAASMAEVTKAGHVYVISNIGSFGENTFKIGMTRRLIPEDRIRELGSASVPFKYDIHAMIYSDNAPELENTLHKEFGSKRLNLVNRRREFFDVTLEEIENVVKKYNSKIVFTHIAEAEEYRESLAIRHERENTKSANERAEKEEIEIVAI